MHYAVLLIGSLSDVQQTQRSSEAVVRALGAVVSLLWFETYGRTADRNMESCAISGIEV